MEKQMTNEKEQAQEQISITNVGIDKSSEINNITISNTGTIEVTISALYRQDNQQTTFLIDPSATIPQGNSKTINISNLGLTAEPDAVFIATTERGTKSIGVNEIQLKYEETQGQINTTALSIGSLMLTFDSLNWASSNANGNSLGTWTQTWTVPTGYCAWRLNLTNTDDQQRDLTINQYSGFAISLVNSPKTTTWYLNNVQQTIKFNQTASVTFLWDVSLAQAQYASSNQIGINNVFLTLFGNYSDGKPLAQTIPFEAITLV